MGFFWILGGVNPFTEFIRYIDYEKLLRNGGSFIGSQQTWASWLCVLQRSMGVVWISGMCGGE